MPLLSDDSVDMLVRGKAISIGYRPVKPKPVVSAPPTPSKKPKKLKHKTAPTEPASKNRKSENDETTCPICLGKTRTIIQNRE